MSDNHLWGGHVSAELHTYDVSKKSRCQCSDLRLRAKLHYKAAAQSHLAEGLPSAPLTAIVHKHS